MVVGRFLALFIVLTMSATPILHSLSVSSVATINSSDVDISKICKSHIIEGVPYAGQKEGFYCYFACCAMIFQYHGINTSLHELLYNAGTGYSLYYPNTSEEIPSKRLPVEGRLLLDNNFLGNLYGFSYECWYPYENNMSEEDCWGEYWIRVKQNISNDTPVITAVNPFSLPSLKQQFGLPEIMWGIIGIGKHMIVIVGYNEDNQSVCYNDPSAEYYGDSKYGDHAWMKLDDLRKAVSNNMLTEYLICKFKKISDPLPKNDVFEKVHKINIERLKGNLSAYYVGHKFNEPYNFMLGINASKRLKMDFEKGAGRRLKTIFLYKMKGDMNINYRLIDFLYFLYSYHSSSHLSIFDILILGQTNPYENIAVEKTYAAKYLWNNTDVSEICEYDAILLEQESENWTKLSSYYSEFMKRGKFMSLSWALLLMNNMADALDNIIAIEKAIIIGPDES